MLEKSENITNLAAALLKAQKAIGVAIKDAKNPYFKSNYADLKAVIEAVKEPLNENGITFLQAVNNNGQELPVIETMLLHESGQFISSVTPVFCAKPNDPQAFGSGVTYSKRYALQAMLGLPTADDDGEGAMARGKKKEPKPSERTIDEILTDACKSYMETYEKEIADGFYVSPKKFKDALKAVYGKLPPKDKKGFKWDDDGVKMLVLMLKLEDVLDEVPE